MSAPPTPPPSSAPSGTASKAAAMRDEAPYYLRALLTVDSLQPPDDAVWARVLDGWTRTPARGADGQLSEAAAAVARLVRREDRPGVEAALTVLAHHPHSSTPNPLIVSRVGGAPGQEGGSQGDGQFAVRVFARYLTELEALTESLTRAVLREPTLRLSPGARVLVSINMDGRAYDLTSGRVRPGWIRRGRRGVLGAFFAANREVLVVTLGVLMLTLLFVLLIVPDGPYSPLGKLYGVVERVLSAVMLNALILFSQFLFWLRQRDVIEWEKP